MPWLASNGCIVQGSMECNTIQEKSKPVHNQYNTDQDQFTKVHDQNITGQKQYNTLKVETTRYKNVCAIADCYQHIQHNTCKQLDSGSGLSYPEGEANDENNTCFLRKVNQEKSNGMIGNRRGWANSLPLISQV